ncbi:MAG: UDP-N-acetylglucosamine 2-epimerase [Pseudomonadota bacterium]
MSTQVDRTRVALVTGTRAEWGLLRAPALAIRASDRLDLHLIATAAHLSANHGETVNEIIADGFEVDARIPTLVDGDDTRAISKSLANGVAAFADHFAQFRPDMVVVLGDRYEILGVVQAALLSRIPVAHLCGGDITEGAFDDAIRHAITKMAHVHLVTNADAARRVRQLGEDPAHIHNVGSPAIDAILEVERISRSDLFADLGLPERNRLITATFHPPTLETTDPMSQMEALLNAFDALGDDVAIILTGSNADTGAQRLTKMAERFASERAHVAFVTSLGQRRYFSALAVSDAVVGNSSSGLYDAPSFDVPTVNIGTRQQGRLRATSVIDCATTTPAITAAIAKAFAMDCTGTVNLYGDGHASRQIVRILEAIEDPASLVVKRFHEVC